MSDDEGMVLALIGAGFVLGASLVGLTLTHSWRADAVAHGAAHFDATTAKFTWNDTPKPAEKP